MSYKSADQLANDALNKEETLFASAARTATANSDDQTNASHVAVIVTIDVTAATSTPSVVFTIQMKDSLSGKYIDLLASVAITGVGTTTLVIHPSVTAANNTKLNFSLPKVWRLRAVHADTDSITYTASANYVQA